ncbi:transcriptional repressor [Noviherbaspirillum cavernae]|uniref:Transcriptional repressor n=1 Tax=Noviherbaspirillum cavernae TaxID=2320862 RepID=A0A418WXF6_9BURK|nr:Fur family transcriptional regulator [Noviherbaspirillum cavernae]RJG04920.1 transcriptional repressor [Noviherbaspirillum cavernae]
MKSKSDVSSVQRQRRPSSQQILALAEKQLRDASVRITDARVKVLAALLGADRALSHQDLQDTFVDMDRVTLYRALDCLTDAGLAHKIASDDRVFRYSAGAESSTSARQNGHGAQHQHGHFKCTRCSRVFCLDSIGDAALLQSALQESLGKGFQGHDIEFTIKGWCADCAH